MAEKTYPVGWSWVFMPNPPKPGEWEENMCALLKWQGFRRRDSIVILAEGAQDTEGNPIGSTDVQKVPVGRAAEDTG